MSSYFDIDDLFQNLPLEKKKRKKRFGLFSIKDTLIKNLFFLETSYLLFLFASGLCFLQLLFNPFFPFSNKNLKNSFLPVSESPKTAAFFNSSRLLEELPKNNLFQKNDILTKNEVSHEKFSFVETSSKALNKKQTPRKSFLSDLSWEWGCELSFASGHTSSIIWNGIPDRERLLAEPMTYKNVRFSPCTSIRKKLPLDFSLAFTMKSDAWVKPNSDFSQTFLGIFLESDFFFPVTLSSSNNFFVDKNLTGKPGIRLQTSKMNSELINSYFQLFYEKDSWFKLTSDPETLVSYFLRERYPEVNYPPTFQVYSRKGQGVRVGVRFIQSIPLT